MKASELARLLGGTLENGNQDSDITGISTLAEAKSSDATFITDKRFLAQAATSNAAIFLIPEKLAPIDRPYIALKEVWAGVLKALQEFHPNFERREYSGVHASAVVHPGARVAKDAVLGPHVVVGAETEIGAGCYIGPGVVIGARCKIGDNSIIYPNAVIEAGTVLGQNVIVQPGAVVGGDGFKYEIIGGRWTKIPQVGHVELGDFAEVGANSCLDRASYSVTLVGRDTKIDNLVQIAHNVHVGNNCVVVAQTGIAGSTTIGDNSILAAQTGVADNLQIGQRVVLMAQAGVKDNIPDGQTWFGTPARPFVEEARIIAASKKLPQLQTEISAMAKRLAELEAELDKLKQG